MQKQPIQLIGQLSVARNEMNRHKKIWKRMAFASAWLHHKLWRICQKT